MTIKIHIDKAPVSHIDKKLFGNFIEHIENCILGGICDPESPLADSTGIRTDVLEKCKELAPPILRFPGGTVIGIYHWEDHVGPVENRKKMRNLIWGNRLCHEFGTAEFVTYCRQIGAEPMICINMPTGSAEEAAHWVEYCNGTDDTYYANLRRAHGYPEPFNVKYWCIGNESHAEPDLGWQHNVDIYIREAWEFTKYMKLTDPTLKLVFVGHDEAWNRAVLDSLGDVCDYLSLHYYTQTPDFSHIERFETKSLRAVEQLLDEYNQKELTHSRWYRFPPRAENIRIALDEWNIWSNRPTSADPYGLFDRYDWTSALWVAKFLHMMIRHSHHIGIGNMAQMVNVIAPIVAEKDGSWKQTIFYPMRLYPAFCGESLLNVSYDCPQLDLVATLRNGGGYAIFAVNTAADPLTVELEAPLRSHSVLTCASPDLVNDAQHDYVQEYTLSPSGNSAILPPHSISLLTI